MRANRSIAFYIDSLKVGGAERVLLHWARWCQEAGWRVVVVTRRGPASDAYPLPEGVDRWLEPADGPLMGLLGWWAFPARLLRLRRLLKQGQFQVVVGVTTLPAVKVLLACRGLDLACVVSERNYPPAKPPSLLWRGLRRLAYPWANLHVVQTRASGDWLRRHCGATHQLLLPNPVVWPLPALEPHLEPADWLPQSAPVLLAAGTKAFQKGFDRLVEAFALLAGPWPELRLVILGLPSTPYHGLDQQGWLRQRLRDPALQSRLLMPGVAGNIGAWYGRATLFALPSRYEGFPNVLLEAMAAGCACVAADCATGPADLIRTGENGLLLPAEAPASLWAERLSGLLANPAERQRMGEAALAVRQTFDAATLRRRFLESLDHLLPHG
ncbi:MAG: glycosyltransferase [Cyanobacteriota bacterium]|jgi:glycosyltransferase involved in cell wall biosynthesis|nr:glycosyltransferase [Cyanobacteriota bacterium]